MSVEDHVDYLRVKLPKNINGRLWSCMVENGQEENIFNVEQFVKSLILNCADIGRNLQMFSGWSPDI